MELVVITIVRFASLPLILSLSLSLSSSHSLSLLSFFFSLSSFPPQLKSIAVFPRSTGYFLSYTYFFVANLFFNTYIFSTIRLYPVSLLCGFLFQLGFYFSGTPGSDGEDQALFSVERVRKEGRKNDREKEREKSRNKKCKENECKIGWVSQVEVDDAMMMTMEKKEEKDLLNANELDFHYSSLLLSIYTQFKHHSPFFVHSFLRVK